MDNFYEEFCIADIFPAEYNPRKISDEEFKKLKESLTLFGICKPVIANSNGIIIAGHQRTRAMKELKFKHCPVFVLNKKVAVHDEIRFNLMHNSIESENCKCDILDSDKLNFGFNEVTSDKIKNIEKGLGVIIKCICKLMSKYGNFDCAIINSSGKIIHNADYAYCCKILNQNLIVYKMEDEKIEKFLKYINSNYGTYSYDKLNIKPYVQTHCQVSRKFSSRGSTLYKKHVLKNIKKSDSIIDFGAGKKLYINYLRNNGYKAYAYEPYFKLKNTEHLDISEVIKDINNIQFKIEKSGLFDVVILDSVLNSITSKEYEAYVLTTCNALLKSSGVMYIGTRNIKSVEASLNQKKSTDKIRGLEFMDKDNFSATFRKGVWTLQKFNTKESLENLLYEYFDNVYIDSSNKSQLYAICKQPKKLSKEKYQIALNIEFNMEYPNGFHHNRHERIVHSILDNH